MCEVLIIDKKSVHELYCEIDSEQAKKRLVLEARVLEPI